MIEERLHYVRIAENEALPDLRDRAPFRALVILEASYSDDWQAEASKWLVDQGCRYMMAWGPRCTTWDDSVDLAVVGSGEHEIAEDDFVMTTWHDDESLESAMWYAQFNALSSYADVPLVDAVLLHVSPTERETDLRALWEQARDLADREAGQASNSSTQAGTILDARPRRVWWKKMLP